eukprot:6197150-Pleurochrysis_carterae.AAC.1
MSIRSPMRSRRKASDARNAAPQDTPVLRPPLAAAAACASWWRRRIIEKAVALEMGWPSSSPPAGASSRSSWIVLRASRNTSPFGPAHDVSTAAIISRRSWPTGRSPPLSPHSMLRTMGSGMTSIIAATSRM